MKATVPKKELLRHGKHLKTLRFSKEAINEAEVNLVVSEKFVVTGPGFSETLECKPVKWGAATMPYRTWAHLVLKLVPVTKLKEITISIGNREFRYGEMKIVHPAIYVSGPDRSSVEIPPDARPIEVALFAIRNDNFIPKGSILEKRVRKFVDQARNEILGSQTLLSKYGVTIEDIISLVAERASLEGEERLIQVLLDSQRW